MKMKGADASYSLAVEFLDAARGVTKRIGLPDGGMLDVRIPAGIEDGADAAPGRQGRPGLRRRAAGRRLRRDPCRSRTPISAAKDNDIHLDLPVTAAEAVLGGKVEVPTIDGPVTLTVPAGLQHRPNLRLRARGILDQRAKQRGDQYVHLQVILPDDADGALKEFLEKWAAGHAYDPRQSMERSHDHGRGGGAGRRPYDRRVERWVARRPAASVGRRRGRGLRRATWRAPNFLPISRSRWASTKSRRDRGRSA